jgi:uncharacterized protein (TIGR03382 family)
MKTSLLKRSLRAAGLALALGLGLAAASPSAQAATVQITLGGNNWTFAYNNYPNSVSQQFDVTGDGNNDSIYLVKYDPNGFRRIELRTDNSTSTDNMNFIAQATKFNSIFLSDSSAKPFTITDQSINNGSPTAAFAQGTSSNGSLTLTRVVFDNASTTAPSDFSPSAGPYTEWSATSTAVPEPGTFIPAAVLVAGALLRRRRSRSHRSGRATA